VVAEPAYRAATRSAPAREETIAARIWLPKQPGPLRDAPDQGILKERGDNVARSIPDPPMHVGTDEISTAGGRSNGYLSWGCRRHPTNRGRSTASTTGEPTPPPTGCRPPRSSVATSSTCVSPQACHDFLHNRTRRQPEPICRPAWGSRRLPACVGMTLRRRQAGAVIYIGQTGKWRVAPSTGTDYARPGRRPGTLEARGGSAGDSAARVNLQSGPK
jgi:hypothetical protein